MKNYLERFNVMVDELMSDLRARVTHFWAGEPVSETEIKRVEDTLGYALDPSIKTFYKQANGLQLRWLDTGSEFYITGRDDSTRTERSKNIQGDDDYANGVVNILPLAECLVDRSYEEILYFDWMNDDGKREFGGTEYGLLTFSQAVRPFDDFSFYNSMGFFVGEEVANPKIIMGDDHNACWTDSRTTLLASYLEFILQNRGLVQARRDMYGQYAGHREAAVVTESAPPIALNKLLPKRAQINLSEVVQGLRVVFDDEHGGKARGTVIEQLAATTTPNHWPYSPEFLRVAVDGGGEVLIPAKKAAKLKSDAYESALANPDDFFEKLMSATPRERFETMGSVAVNSFRYLVQQLTAHTQGSTEGVEFKMPSRAPRYVALVSGLKTERAIEVLLTMVEDWLDDEAHYGSKLSIERDHFDSEEYRADSAGYEDVIELAFSTLALVVCRAYDEAAFSSIRVRFGDQTADRIGALAMRLGSLRINVGANDYANTKFLQRAVEAMPGTVERSTSQGYHGSQFGLVDVPVIF